jgi:hypothetical protein
MGALKFFKSKADANLEPKITVLIRIKLYFSDFQGALYRAPT